MRWAYLVLLTLSLSVVFAFIAYAQPAKSVSDLTFPLCDQYANAYGAAVRASCNTLMQGFGPQFSPVFPSIQFYHCYLEIAEGFSVAAALLIFFRWLKVLPKDEIHLGRGLRLASLVVFVGGTSVFGVLAAVDLLQEENAWWLNVVQRSLTVLGEGELAFLSMVVAVVGLTLYRSSRGLWTSLEAAVTLFAAPAVLLLEVGLVLVRPGFPPSEMLRQAADFTRPLAVGGIYLISNWFVLIVASCLLLSSLSWGSVRARYRLRQASLADRAHFEFTPVPGLSASSRFSGF